MSYSKEIHKLLGKKHIEEGDTVRVSNDRFTAEGMLMPRTYEKDIIVLKLSSGYNTGIKAQSAEITLVKKGERQKTPKTTAGEEAHRGEIAILGCGGTIASKVEYKTGAVYPAISPHELHSAFPALEKIARVHSKQLFSLYSGDMNSGHWQEIAKETQKEINSGATGIVLMHGTDTMHYTSAALSFMLQSLPVPVILVGSQRSSDRPSSDNEFNLLNSVYAAKQDFAEVGLCMHANSSDDYAHLHRGTRVRKMHTSARSAFKSVNSEPIAKVDYKTGTFEGYITYNTRNSQKNKLHVDSRISENVAMIYVHPNIQPKLISSLGKYDGVVLIGTGLGHAPTNPFNDKSVKPILPEIKGLVDSGIPVVMASQTIFGRVNMNVYSYGRMLKDAGVMGDGLDMTPETAFVKLSWILGHEKKMNKIRGEFHTNLAGEFSERSYIGEA